MASYPVLNPKDIEKYFTNAEIFKIFWRNKRILLFLIEENMITIDEYCFSIISCDHGYCQCFQPEIKPFLTKENIKKYFKTSEDDEFIENLKKEVDDDFFTKRKEGENDHYLWSYYFDIYKFKFIDNFKCKSSALTLFYQT